MACEQMKGKVDYLEHTNQQFKTEFGKCRELFVKKLHDYGPAWRILRPSSVTDQILIKANRIRSIEIKKEALVNEGVYEEFQGIINARDLGGISVGGKTIRPGRLLRTAHLSDATDDDIGRVKIPHLITHKTGKNLQFDYASGCDFTADLSAYKLVIQCGGCTINRRQMLFRIQQCEKAGVAITNYGVCISELKGVLKRVLSPFPDLTKIYQQ